MKVGFWTPISFEKLEKTSIEARLEKVDSYFYLGGKKAVVISNRVTHQGKGTALRDTKASYVWTALKVISYFTIILPLLALAAKYYLRNKHSFYIINEQKCKYIIANYLKKRAYQKIALKLKNELPVLVINAEANLVKERHLRLKQWLNNPKNVTDVTAIYLNTQIYMKKRDNLNKSKKSTTVVCNGVIGASVSSLFGFATRSIAEVTAASLSGYVPEAVTKYTVSSMTKFATQPIEASVTKNLAHTASSSETANSVSAQIACVHAKNDLLKTDLAKTIQDMLIQIYPDANYINPSLLTSTKLYREFYNAHLEKKCAELRNLENLSPFSSPEALLSSQLFKQHFPFPTYEEIRKDLNITTLTEPYTSCIGSAGTFFI